MITKQNLSFTFSNNTLFFGALVVKAFLLIGGPTTKMKNIISKKKKKNCFLGQEGPSSFRSDLNSCEVTPSVT